MNTSLRAFCLLIVLSVSAAVAGPLRFRVTLDGKAAPAGAQGRLLVFMAAGAEGGEILGAGFSPGKAWVAAREVTHIAPGETIDFDPDTQAYPRPFSRATAGGYRFMALLDTDHTYAYHGRDEGDYYGPVVALRNLDPADAAPVKLTLDRRAEARRRVADTEEAKLVEFESPSLSAFWGRPIVMRAGVVLPPGFGAAPERRYPAVYRVHGFGGDHTSAWREGPALRKAMRDGKSQDVVHVFLDGSFPSGHHEFADSVNNGPWGRALTTEFIPYLEKRYRLIPAAHARFLTGHSSGGWSTLWLQVNYPDFFGGVWSTAPDPVDLRSFTGVDVTPGSKENAYRTREGKPRNLIRRDGKELASLEEFIGQEIVLGDYGGQFSSFEWVWSPRGPDGRPLQLFNRRTGELNPAVLEAWRKYDIRLLLDARWAALGPKLRGKLHIFCGEQDTFHLEEAVKLLCGFLKERGSDAVCEIVPGRDHGTLYRPYKSYPDGLAERIRREMEASSLASR